MFESFTMNYVPADLSTVDLRAGLPAEPLPGALLGFRSLGFRVVGPAHMPMLFMFVNKNTHGTCVDPLHTWEFDITCEKVSTQNQAGDVRLHSLRQPPCPAMT